MAGVGALNLSLLSRGIGEVQTNGHEKVEVFLEPEDYYNFVNSDRYYLPPIKTNFSFGHGSSSLSTRGSREFNEIHLPKTFTTRKGALLLFSEDLALRDKEREATHKNAETLSIHTVEDLARSILSYGSHERQTDSASVYMKFLHQKREMKRQIRPGFSAKRYLATWTRTWDDSVLETVISKGYITERSLFHYNLVIPHLRRRLIAEDLSHYPAPYRLMRSMLLYPGSLSGYTFYRAVTETEDLFEEKQERAAARRVKASSTIRVIKTQQDGLQKEVSYASLDRTSQEEVITDLLVKSAVHFALKKQQEYVEETMKEIDDSRRVGSAEIRKISAHTPVPDFNMKEAVESLLDSHRSGTSALDADFPEVENTSHSSDYGGSFKGCTIPKHEKTRHKSGSRSWTYEGSEKEYIGSTPVVTLREGVSPILTSNIPHLPPIKSKVPLTPILDVSREQTQQHLPLPPIDKLPHVNILSPTPQHTVLSGVSPSVDRVGQAPSEVEETGSEWGISSVHSERDRGFRHVSTQWKGSQQSLKSSKKGSGSVIGESVKGSVVCAPDGEIVKVGGSILPDTASLAGSQTARTDLDRGIGGMEDTDVSDNEPDMWKSREDIFNIPSEEKSTSTKEASQKEHGDHASTDDGLGASFRLEHGDKSDGEGESSARTGTELDLFRVTPQSKSKPSRMSKLLSDPSGTQSTLLVFEEKTETSLSSKQFDQDDVIEDDVELQRRTSSESRGSQRKHGATPRNHSESHSADVDVKIDDVTVVSAWSGESDDDEMKKVKKHSALSSKSATYAGDRKSATSADLPHDEEKRHLTVSEHVSRRSSYDKQVDSHDDEVNLHKLGSEVDDKTSTVDVKSLLGSHRTSAKSAASGYHGDRLVRDVEVAGSDKQVDPADHEDRSSSPEWTQPSPLSKSPDDFTFVQSEEGNFKEQTSEVIINDRVADEISLADLKLSIDEDVDVTQQQANMADVVRRKTSTEKSSVVSGQSDALRVSGSQIFSPPPSPPHKQPVSKTRPESAASEQMIVDALTGHAQKIAAKVLSKVEAGRDLEADIRQAAALWTKEHPPRVVSRSQSVQEFINTEAVEEITRHRANSAAPTAQEYKDLIRQSLTTAVAMVAGKEPNAFPFDAEVSPELLDALASQSLSPDDIEIVTDDEGRNIIRSKSHMLNELGGVKEGHIYISGGSTSDRSLKKTISIPSERGSAADVGDYDVINYNNADVVSDRKSSLRASVSSSPEPDDFTKALQNAETESKKSSGSSKHVVIADEVKSAKTTLSQASKKSMESKSSEELKKSKAKKKSLLDRDEFVVGKVNSTNELEKLYGPPTPPPKVDLPAKTTVSPLDNEAVAVIDKEEVPQEYVPDVQTETPRSADKPKVKGPAKSKSISSESEVESVTQKPKPDSVLEKKATVTKSSAKVAVQPPQKKTEVEVPSKPRPPPPIPALPVPASKPKAQKPKKEPVPPKKEEKKKAVKKKGKKAKKEEPAPPKAATPPPKPATPPPPSPPKAKTPPKPATPEQSISPISSVEKSDDEMEFIIIRDETPSPEPVRPRKEPSPVREPSPKTEPPSEPQSEDEDTALKSITSKEARAAKRAAAANKRREEVERRRREREEQLKREKEEQERQERLRREMEEERRKLEEERRLRRQREAAEREKEEEEERERERRKQLELEREKRQKEEYARKLEEMKKRQAEEDLKRQELQRQRELEEEERRKEEELRMSQMAEQERLEYERKKKEEEELRKLKEEEDRKRREEQAQRALEEARRLAEDMARRQAELEQRLRFNRELQLEAGGLEHTQDITRMFVFSYFELLQWLGLDIPEFELQKLNSL